MAARLSVIIPTYNRADLIGRAIRSSLEQLAGEDEVVVIDDGSTDRTAEVVGAIADDRLRYVVQPNGGVSAARNHGARIASGEYLLFLDSDDLWMPGAIDRIRNQIERTGASIVAGERIEFEHESELAGIVPNDDAVLVYDDLFSAAEAKHYLPGTGISVKRKDLIAAGGFLEDPHSHEDWDMWLRMGSCHGFVFCKAALYGYYRPISQPHTGLSVMTERAYWGTIKVLRRERRGEYNGDGLSRSQREGRRRLVTWIAKTHMYYLSRAGAPMSGLLLYLRLLPRMMADRQWPFLRGEPLHVVRCLVRKVLGRVPEAEEQRLLAVSAAGDGGVDREQ